MAGSSEHFLPGQPAERGATSVHHKDKMTKLRASLESFRRWLEHRRLPMHVALLAVLICLPSLWLGWVADDHVLRLRLSDPPLYPDWQSSPLNLFTFVEGDVSLNQRLIADGVLPWWTDAEHRVAFFRPLSGISHWIDNVLWPESPWLAHLHSLFWLAAAVAAAAVLYRRLLGVGWIAGLAALLFALDDSHGFPAMWIANRNSTISVVFALLALIAHDAWRRREGRGWAVVAPTALAIGLLGGEMAIAAGAYILAYAVFLDDGHWKDRLASLIPCTVTGVLWWLAYSAMGFGASGSGLYIDPLADPMRFGAAVIERAPLLLMGLWWLPSELHAVISVNARDVLWLFASGVVIVAAVLATPLLRRDRTARFFAAGTVLSIFPGCATFPSDRLLFLAGFGAMGLAAQIIAGVLDSHDWVPTARLWRTPARVVAVILAVAHIPLAPVSMMGSMSGLQTIDRVIDRAAGSFPSGSGVVGQRVIMANTPTAYVSMFGPTIQLLAHHPVANRGLLLASGIEPTQISRPDSYTLVVRPEGGYLKPAGEPAPGHDADQRLFDMRYVFPMFDRLFRDGPMAVGDSVDLGDVTVDVRTVTLGGRPDEVAFHFARPLEDASFRWLQWRDGVYVSFQPPPVGSSVTLPAVTVPMLPLSMHCRVRN
jgi:hypothetical protein